MRLAVLALLVPTLALAQTTTFLAPTKAVGPGGATTQTAASAAGNVPTLVTDGILISGQGYARVILSAASGQTLSGAGTLRFYLCDTVLNRCIKNQNVSFTVTTSGVRDAVFEDLVIGVAGKNQYLYVEAVSVTSSSGALTVTVQTWKRG